MWALDSKQERLFLWLLSFVALDKRKLPAALAAEAFDVASSFEAPKLQSSKAPKLQSFKASKLQSFKASKLQSFEALELQSLKLQSLQARGKINSFRPQAGGLLSFVISNKRKVTKEKCFFVNQGPARSVLTRACATRDIHVPVAHGVHPARRPSGVLLLTRVTSFAALVERLYFVLKARAKPEQSTSKAQLVPCELQHKPDYFPRPRTITNTTNPTTATPTPNTPNSTIR
ncbi:hypothetical protein [Lysobacter capsici]|uniref:hypothetical protein n=1 Tax=Lysobacter capsici TaxID=435897 RepID=UPI0011E06481|nr:hypothetical protein [Lysobacter capsici]